MTEPPINKQQIPHDLSCMLTWKVDHIGKCLDNIPYVEKNGFFCKEKSTKKKIEHSQQIISETNRNQTISFNVDINFLFPEYRIVYSSKDVEYVGHPILAPIQYKNLRDPMFGLLESRFIYVLMKFPEDCIFDKPKKYFRKDQIGCFWVREEWVVPYDHYSYKNILKGSIDFIKNWKPSQKH